MIWVCEPLARTALLARGWLIEATDRPAHGRARVDADQARRAIATVHASDAVGTHTLGSSAFTIDYVASQDEAAQAHGAT